METSRSLRRMASLPTIEEGSPRRGGRKQILVTINLSPHRTPGRASGGARVRGFRGLRRRGRTDQVGILSLRSAKVTVLKNRSAPAVFTLVATAARFLGNISALAQVAAFEKIPSIVLHPARCTDFRPPFNNYAKAIWNRNGIAIDYGSMTKAGLEGALVRFISRPATTPIMREAFRDIDPRPGGDGTAP